MLSPVIQKYLNQFLAKELGLQTSSLQFCSIGGGCINETYQVNLNANVKFFLKINSLKKYPVLFLKEKNGLELLASKKIIRVPAIITYAEIGDYQILLLEWIESAVRTEEFW